MTDGSIKALLLVLQALEENLQVSERLLASARHRIALGDQELAQFEAQLAAARRALPILTAHALALSGKVLVQ